MGSRTQCLTMEERIDILYNIQVHGMTPSAVARALNQSHPTISNIYGMYKKYGFVNRMYKPSTKKLLLKDRENYIENIVRRRQAILDPEAKEVAQ